MNGYLAAIRRFESVPIDNGDGSAINEKQQQQLQQMRAALMEDPGLDSELHTDRFLCRFLAAENFDLAKGIAMLREHFRWRQEHGADRPWEALLASVPERVQKHASPPYRGGEDMDGCPVFWDSPGRIDVEGVLRTCRTEEIVRYHSVVFMEQVYDQLRIQSEKHGRLIDRIVVVQDMTGFGLRSHRALFSVLAQVVTQSRNANYPQVLKQLIVINAPRVVDLAWGLVKPFLRERTRKKVEIKRDKSAILFLREKMAPDCIPARYGGAMEDPPLPQMVPVADYLASSIDMDAMIEAVVDRGSKFCLEYEMEVDDVLSWTFQSRDKDIVMGILDKETGQWLQPRQKYNTQEIPGMGSFCAPSAGTVVVVFDNTSSLFSSKMVSYNIEHIPARGGSSPTHAPMAEAQMVPVSEGQVRDRPRAAPQSLFTPGRSLGRTAVV